MSDPNIEEVRIFNSENNTNYYLCVRKDRIQQFFDFIARDRRTVFIPVVMPGLSWAAISGLDAIFDRRPLKFPSQDIVNWLRDRQTTYLGHPDPVITAQEVEHALERFATVYPPDVRSMIGDTV